MTTLQFDDLFVECDSASQSTDTSHDNQPGNYHYRLPLRYELGDIPYEVACCDFTFPLTWYNLETDVKLIWTVDNKISIYETTIYAGLYCDVTELIESINAAIRDSIVDFPTVIPPKFFFNRGKNKVGFLASRQNDPTLEPKIVAMPNELAKLLGYYNENKILSCNMSNDIHALYIHLDVIEPQIVGSKLERVLQVVHLPDNLKYGKMEKVTFFPKKYVPLALKEFHMLKITVKDARGQILNFRYGSTKIWLHFRRRNPWRNTT